MRMLSNEILMDSYVRAVELKLEKEFIELLLIEIKRRKLVISEDYSPAQAN